MRNNEKLNYPIFYRNFNKSAIWCKSSIGQHNFYDVVGWLSMVNIVFLTTFN